MNAHYRRSMFSRRNVVPFTFFIFLIIVAFFGLTVGTKQSAAKEGADSQLPNGMPALSH